MEDFSEKIFLNIKQEPEENFVLYLPSECEEVKDEPMEKTHKVCEMCNEHKVDLKPLNKKASTCSYCDLFFTCNNCKEKHIFQEHRRETDWICNKCTYTTNNRACLIQHFRSHSKKFSCETCSKKFSIPYRLKVHQMNQRHGIYSSKLLVKLQCFLCPSSFATDVGLTEHQRHVHGESLSHCDVCGKTYRNMRSIRRHIQLHARINCSICQGLIRLKQIKEHMKKHSK